MDIPLLMPEFNFGIAEFIDCWRGIEKTFYNPCAYLHENFADFIYLFKFDL